MCMRSDLGLILAVPNGPSGLIAVGEIHPG
jgi:hypothetical protein